MKENLLWGYLCFIEKLTRDVRNSIYKLDHVNNKDYEETLIEISNLLPTCKLVIKECTPFFKDGLGAFQFFQLKEVYDVLKRDYDYYKKRDVVGNLIG